MVRGLLTMGLPYGLNELKFRFQPCLLTIPFDNRNKSCNTCEALYQWELPTSDSQGQTDFLHAFEVCEWSHWNSSGTIIIWVTKIFNYFSIFTCKTTHYCVPLFCEIPEYNLIHKYAKLNSKINDIFQDLYIYFFEA